MAGKPPSDPSPRAANGPDGAPVPEPSAAGVLSRDSAELRGFVLLSVLIAVMAAVSAWRLSGLVDPYEVDIFLHQFLLHEGPAAPLAIAILALALLLARKVPAGEIEKLVRLFAERPLAVAAVALALLALGTLVVYRNHPLAMDEYMPYFQAQVFAEGELYGRYPPDLMHLLVPPPFLNRTFVAASLSTGKIISTYAPGFSLLLTPFMVLGVPWLLNPLLAAGSLLLIAHLARRWLSDPLAPGWAVLLTLASPAFTINALSYYSLTAHLFLNLLFVCLLLRRTVPRAALAGVVGSLALGLHNPVPHALFALPWLLWLAGRREWRHLAALAAGYLPLTLLLNVGWLQVRGVIGAENAALQAAAAVAPATIDTSILGEIRTFFGVLELPSADFLARRYLGFLKLFLWAVPGLPILAILGYRKVRHRVRFRLFGWSAVATIVFFLFVLFDQGHGWGYRYFHSAWAVLPLLGAAALADSSPRWRSLVGTAALLSLFAGTYLRCDQVHRFLDRHLAQVATVEDSVAQVRFVALAGGYYVQDLIQNDPFLRGPVWTFMSVGRQRDAELIERLFPDARLAVDRGNSTAWVVE